MYFREELVGRETLPLDITAKFGRLRPPPHRERLILSRIAARGGSRGSEESVDPLAQSGKTRVGLRLVV